MAGIITRRPWTNPPSSLQLLNRSSPLAVGFSHPKSVFYVMAPQYAPSCYNAASPGTILNLAGATNGTLNDAGSGFTLKPTAVPGGLGLQQSTTLGNGPRISTGIVLDSTSFAQGTVYWGQIPTDAFNSGTRMFPWDAETAGGSPEFHAQRYTDNNWYVGWSNATTAGRVQVALTAALWSPGVLAHYALTWVNGAKAKLYCNGVLIGTAAANTTTTAPSSATDVFTHPSAGAFSGTLLYFGMGTAEHSAGLVAAMARNPWAILQARRRRFHVGSFAAAGSVGAATGTAAVVGLSGSVAVVASTAVAAGLSGSVGASASSSVAAGLSGSVGVAAGTDADVGLSGSIAAAAGNTAVAGVSAKADGVGTSAGTALAVGLSGSIGAASGAAAVVGLSPGGSVGAATGNTAVAGLSGSVAVAAGAVADVGIAGSIGQSQGTATVVGQSQPGSIGTSASSAQVTGLSGSVAAAAASAVAAMQSGSVFFVTASGQVVGIAGSAAAGVGVAAVQALSGSIARANAAAVASGLSPAGTVGVGSVVSVTIVNGIGLFVPPAYEDPRYLDRGRADDMTTKGKARDDSVAGSLTDWTVN